MSRLSLLDVVTKSGFQDFNEVVTLLKKKDINFLHAKNRRYKKGKKLAMVMTFSCPDRADVYDLMDRVFQTKIRRNKEKLVWSSNQVEVTVPQRHFPKVLGLLKIELL